MLGNILPMSSRLGLGDDDLTRLGPDRANRVVAFRLIIQLSQRMRTLMDQRLRPDGLTTQQAALITAVDALGHPSLSQTAKALGTTHQNARQIADALARKGFLTITPDPADARVRRLRTTARSRRYWQGRSDDDQDHVVDWFAGLDAGEATALVASLTKIAATLDLTGEFGTET
jgi:DNA-binding MarR family transcriptional regulator